MWYFYGIVTNVTGNCYGWNIARWIPGVGVLLWRGVGAVVEGSIKPSLPQTGKGYSFTGFKAVDHHWPSTCIPWPGHQNSEWSTKKARMGVQSREKFGELTFGFEWDGIFRTSTQVWKVLGSWNGRWWRQHQQSQASLSRAAFKCKISSHSHTHPGKSYFDIRGT